MSNYPSPSFDRFIAVLHDYYPLAFLVAYCSAIYQLAMYTALAASSYIITTFPLSRKVSAHITLSTLLSDISLS